MTRKPRPPTGDGGARIEAEMSLERVVEASGITLTRHGSKITFGCPFHTGDSTTASINTKANTWSCSICKVEGAGVVAFTMKSKGVSKKHAIELLRTDTIGDSNATTAKPLKRISRQTLPTPFSPDASDTALLQSVSDYYADALTRHADPTTLLTELGLTSSELVTEHRLGLCERTLAYRLPPSNRKGGAAIREQLTRIGVMRDSGQEALRGCVTVPLFDQHGVIAGLYGRRLLFNATKHDSRDVFTSSSVNALWNSKVFGASPDIVVFESIFDALTTWCAGTRNVTALHAGADQLGLVVELVKASGTKKITLVRSADSTSVAEPVSKACPSTEVYEAVLPSKAVGRGLAGLPGGVSGVLARSTWVGGKPGKARPTSAFGASIVEMPIVAAPVTIGAETIASSAISPTTIAPSATAPAPVVEPWTSAPPKAAGPAPKTSSPTVDQDVVIALGDRRWRVRGLEANTTYQHLRVNLRVSIERADPRLSGYHVDMIELYSARQRTAYTTQASEELGIDADVIRRDLGAVLLHLEGVQDQMIRAAQKPKETRPEMSEGDREAALALLKDPHLLDRVVADLDRTGAVGEETNKLLIYIAATSRLLDEPLAILVQSSSSAGKSSLVDAVLGFVPEEERVSFSAMTGQSLFYMEAGSLMHRVLCIAEEEGASKVSYGLKLLQSEGSLSIASTAKEAGTGRLVTHEYKVQGPVALCMTTTSTAIDDELQNRCLVLTVDEGQAQTKAIHTRQRERETLQGLLARRDREAVQHLHCNAQRLLRSVHVVNPHAHELVFPTGTTRARRDHRKYLTLIRSITLLHQHQRPLRRVEHNGNTVEFIETTMDDVRVADTLGKQTFGSQGDDLPPHTRELFVRIEELVTADSTARGIDRRDYRFTRRDVRQRLGVGGTQLRVHLARLVDGDYLVVHPSRHGRGVIYELVVWTYPTATTTADSGPSAGHLRGVGGPNAGQVRGGEMETSRMGSSPSDDLSAGSSGSIDKTDERSSSHRHTSPVLNGIGEL